MIYDFAFPVVILIIIFEVLTLIKNKNLDKKSLIISIVILFIFFNIFISPFQITIINETDTKYTDSFLTTSSINKIASTGTTFGGGFLIFSILMRVFNVNDFFSAELLVTFCMSILLMLFFFVVKEIVNYFSSKKNSTIVFLTIIFYLVQYSIAYVFYERKLYYLFAYFFFILGFLNLLRYLKNNRLVNFGMIFACVFVAGMSRPEFFLLSILFIPFLILKDSKIKLTSIIYSLFSIAGFLVVYLSSKDRVHSSFFLNHLPELLRSDLFTRNILIFIIIIAFFIVCLTKLKEQKYALFSGLIGVMTILIYSTSEIFDLRLMMFYAFLFLIIPFASIVTNIKNKHQKLIIKLLLISIVLYSLVATCYLYPNLNRKETKAKIENLYDIYNILADKNNTVFVEYPELYFSLFFKNTNITVKNILTLNEAQFDHAYIITEFYKCNNLSSMAVEFSHISKELETNMFNILEDLEIFLNQSYQLKYYNICYVSKN
ncbi:hypothetical protein JXM83_02805 [Candidatus Woesearchaeota archaeon]|nr:hypothetical protein [Candidatus Woesearchaeota archaeon]